MADPHNLQRFLSAQDSIYSEALAELKAGKKQGHWMWFIFPQIAGLGHSAMAQRYAIASRAEAEAYLGHLVLGSRLIECTNTLNNLSGQTIDDVLGYPDNLKFHSSMTLFSRVDPERKVFHEALAKYFDGRPDENTVRRL